MTALVITLIAITLILFRVPVAFSLFIPSLGYILWFSPFETSAAVERAVSSVNAFPLLAVPLFILAGNLANEAGLGERIFDYAQRVLARLRGGVGYVTVFSSLGFSWMSGNAVSDVAVLGSVQAPQMLKRGYGRPQTAGLIAASSLVTPLMPPSVPAIIFGVASGVSIGALFLASIVPALIVVVVLLGSVWWISRKHVRVSVDQVHREQPLWRHTMGMLPIGLAPVIVLGGILGGVFTPTEAACVLVVFLLLLTGAFTRELSFDGLGRALTSTIRTGGSVLIVIASASLFGWVLTVERVPQQLAVWMTSLTDSSTVFLLLSIALLLVIGMLMDPVSAILVVTPVLMPIATQFGIDPVHYGVVLIFTLLIGLFTPPVGIVLFVLESVTSLKFIEILKGTWPYVMLYLAVAVLIALVPELVLTLGGLAGS